MARTIFYAVLFSLIYAYSSAQDFLYSTRNYTAIHGLPQSQVRAIVEDKSGYLWVGTEGGGLARFDGRDFKVYTTLDGLLTNQVLGLKFDQNDALWIMHPRGVTKFDGHTFQKFQAPGQVLTSRPLKKMYELSDTIFLLSGSGLISKIHNDSLYYWEQEIDVGKQVYGVHTAPGGEVCLLLDDLSFSIRSGNAIHIIPKDEKTGKIFNIFNYENDVLFRAKNGLFRLNLKSKRIESLNWDIPHFVLLYDEKEDKFWTTNGSTLFRETFSDGILKRDTILHEVEVNQVLSDSEGNTWFASNGRGLYKYFLQDFIHCSSENIRGVMSILKDTDGATWIATMHKGLWKIKKGKVSSYVDPKDPYRNSIRCVKESPDGTIWVGTGYGLGRYDKVNDSFHWYTREDGLSGYSILNIEFDDVGMWVGTPNGLNFYDGKSFKIYNTTHGLNANVIMALHYSKKYQTLFIGTDVGINSYKNGKIDEVTISQDVNTEVISLNPYLDSLLLIGTGGTGVVVLNPANRRRKLITTREGLASDFIYFVAADDKDYLWIGTEKGINHVKLDEQYEIVENLHFDYDNGLTGVETNQNAFLLTPEEKYFGLVDGLYQFNDNKQRMTSFDVHLTDVQILYGEYPLSPYADSTFGFYRIPYRPELPPDKNHLTFHFNRVDKRYSKSVKYKYFLENFDKTWSQPSSVNTITYSNLPPGSYTFRVMSTNNNGSWSDTTIAYDFIIKAPFYLTTSFIVGVLFFVSGLITLILYLRVRQKVNRIVMLERIRQKEQESLRKEIARDFHDEMGNQLTRIINYVSLLKLNGNGNGNSDDLYTKVEDSAKYLYNGTRDFIWSIDPVNDELSKLFIHIRDFGEKLFEEKSINFRAFNDVKERVKLPYGFSREANLIFKESMTNAFKSSKASNVTFTLKRDVGMCYEMSLEDDGIGFYTGEIEKSNGLQNIRERANRINAVLRIHSVRNEGTRIVLNFTLTKSIKYGLAL